MRKDSMRIGLGLILALVAARPAAAEFVDENDRKRLQEFLPRLLRECRAREPVVVVPSEKLIDAVAGAWIEYLQKHSMKLESGTIDRLIRDLTTWAEGFVRILAGHALGITAGDLEYLKGDPGTLLEPWLGARTRTAEEVKEIRGQRAELYRRLETRVSKGLEGLDDLEFVRFSLEDARLLGPEDVLRRLRLSVLGDGPSDPSGFVFLVPWTAKQTAYFEKSVDRRLDEAGSWKERIQGWRKEIGEIRAMKRGPDRAEKARTLAEKINGDLHPWMALDAWFASLAEPFAKLAVLENGERFPALNRRLTDKEKSKLAKLKAAIDETK